MEMTHRFVGWLQVMRLSKLVPRGGINLNGIIYEAENNLPCRPVLAHESPFRSLLALEVYRLSLPILCRGPETKLSSSACCPDHGEAKNSAI
jgi:hypothetical protein